MKNIQKYILLLVVLAVLAYTFPIVRDIYLAYTYGSGQIPYYVEKNWETVSLLVISIHNVAAAIWLWQLARKYELSKSIWMSFGLLFGLIAVGIFYLVRINDKLET